MPIISVHSIDTKLRDHLGNMRDLWRHYHDTGRIPSVVASPTGTYVIREY